MRIILALSLLILIASCSTDVKVSKINTRLIEFDTLNIKQHELIDLNLGFNETSGCPGVSIGKDLYPNIHQYDLNWPKEYYSIDKDKFSVRNEYFFSKEDSITRVILREWRWPYRDNKQGITAFFNSGKKQKRFILKFESIKAALQTKYGEPDSSHVYSITKPRFYRKGYKWLNTDDIKSYLFVLGNDSTSYYKIRLITYLN